MSRPRPQRPALRRTGWRVVLVAALLTPASLTWPEVQGHAAAQALQSRRLALQPQLRANSFGQPLHLSSQDVDGRVSGDVHAEVAHPLSELASTFSSPRSVCALLFLHLNVRGCLPSEQGTVLTVTAGPKRSQALGGRYHMSYAMHVEANTPGYVKVSLDAARGPLGTQDYRIVLEAVPIDRGHAFVHLGYGYRYGLVARTAMQAYLGTAGRDKIGFTVVGRDAAGRPQYVQGERGALERNVIRYYLALQAQLSEVTGTPAEQMQSRLRTWFALTERYPAQLHEFELDDYLREKREDLDDEHVQLP